MAGIIINYQRSSDTLSVFIRNPFILGDKKESKLRKISSAFIQGKFYHSNEKQGNGFEDMCRMSRTKRDSHGMDWPSDGGWGTFKFFVLGIFYFVFCF